MFQNNFWNILTGPKLGQVRSKSGQNPQPPAFPTFHLPQYDLAKFLSIVRVKKITLVIAWSVSKANRENINSTESSCF